MSSTDVDSAGAHGFLFQHHEAFAAEVHAFHDALDRSEQLAGSGS